MKAKESARKTPSSGESPRTPRSDSQQSSHRTDENRNHHDNQFMETNGPKTVSSSENKDTSDKTSDVIHRNGNNIEKDITTRLESTVNNEPTSYNVVKVTSYNTGHNETDSSSIHVIKSKVARSSSLGEVHSPGAKIIPSNDRLKTKSVKDLNAVDGKRVPKRAPPKPPRGSIAHLHNSDSKPSPTNHNRNEQRITFEVKSNTLNGSPLISERFSHNKAGEFSNDSYQERTRTAERGKVSVRIQMYAQSVLRYHSSVVLELLTNRASRK